MIERDWRIPVHEQRVPSPWDIGLPDFVCLSFPKQVVVSSEPNFWPYSLQIHCNGLGPKTATLHIYIYIYTVIYLDIIVLFLTFNK